MPIFLSDSKRNEKGVSPAVASILLVAITVVAAATLGVLIVGLGDMEAPLPVETNVYYMPNSPQGAQNILITTSYAENGSPVENVGIKIRDPKGNLQYSQTRTNENGMALVQVSDEYKTNFDILIEYENEIGVRSIGPRGDEWYEELPGKWIIGIIIGFASGVAVSIVSPLVKKKFFNST